MKKKLFTLIELIVVIVILGVLAAIVVPNISSWQKEAEYTAVQSNVRNFQTSSDMYALDFFGEKPSNLQPEFGVPQPLDFRKLIPSYVRQLPKTKGMKYWVDDKGMIWASMVDSPTNVKNTTGSLNWDEQPEAQSYNIYEVEDNSISGAVLDSKKNLVFFKNTEEFPISVDKDKTYAVSTLDENGFESPPATGDYMGYEEYYVPFAGAGSIVEQNPATPSGPKPLQTQVPEGWMAINSAEDLAKMKDNLSGKYILMKNIDMSKTSYASGTGWNPIGSHCGLPFKGQLDGNGLEIKGLYINNPTKDSMGLFGCLEAATIKNLRLIDVNIKGNNYVGSVAGQSKYYGNTHYENLLITGNINGYYGSGGVVGTTNGNSIGQHYITRVHVNANVTSTTRHAGGMVGYASYVILSDSYVEGSVESAAMSGGLFGEMAYSSIQNAYSTAKIVNIGIEKGATMGSFNGHLAPGQVSFYYDKDLVGGTSDGTYYSKSKTTEEMFKKLTFVGWNFDTVWSIKEGEDYPRLRWEVQ